MEVCSPYKVTLTLLTFYQEKLNSRRNFLCTSSVYLLCWSEPSRAQGVRMDFTNPNTMRDCWIMNDSVMGGVSQSSLREDPHGMFFEGQISLENNGGFASMRSLVRFPHGTQLIELLAKGDGKRYKLVLRTELAPRVTYAADFIAEPTWQTYRFHLNQFKATFRGQAIHAPTLSFSDVTEFGILISNSQAGSFAIQLKTLQST
jgi:NADH dehydrogenase [ubiquinone] 1 alpha subcomplex assembly factor 1